MKRVILGLAILVTASNLAVGVAYAAACLGTSGGRHCGTKCVSMPDGSCECQGGCTASEQQWVNAGSKELIAEVEMNAY
jgi:hypothetical protein